MAEVASAFRRVFEALSDTLLHDTHVPDLTELDQAIAKLATVTDKDPDNPRSLLGRSFFPSSSRRSAAILAIS
jgi:hypothetical protein